MEIDCEDHEFKRINLDCYPKDLDQIEEWKNQIVDIGIDENNKDTLNKIDRDIIDDIFIHFRQILIAAGRE